MLSYRTNAIFATPPSLLKRALADNPYAYIVIPLRTFIISFKQSIIFSPSFKKYAT